MKKKISVPVVVIMKRINKLERSIRQPNSNKVSRNRDKSFAAHFFCFFVLRFCYINILFSSLPVMQGVMRHVHNAQIQMAIGVDGICYAVPACFDSLGKIP